MLTIIPIPEGYYCEDCNDYHHKYIECPSNECKAEIKSILHEGCTYTCENCHTNIKVIERNDNSCILDFHKDIIYNDIDVKSLKVDDLPF